MLLFLGSVAAQPIYTTSGMPLYGAPVYAASQPSISSGMPLYGAPVYGGPVYSTVGQPTVYDYGVQPPAVYAPAVYGPPPVAPAPAPAPSGPSPFDTYVANQAARVENYAVTGNNVLWNIPWSQLFPGTPLASGQFDFLTGYAAVNKGEWAGGQEDLIDQQISHFRRTHRGPLTQTQRNQLQDLQLHKQMYHNIKLRRTASLLPITLPGGAGVSTYFKRQSHEDQLQLAQNQLDDARRTYDKTPNPQNAEQVQQAHENIRQAQDWKEADTFDLLGTNFGNAGRLAPFFRTKASTKAKQTAQQKRQDAEAAYRKDPTDVNRLKLQIAMATVKAWHADNDANKQEIAYASIGGSSLSKLLGVVGNAQDFQNEERYWDKVARMNRALVHLERANAMKNATAPGNSVQQRMLALDNYGPAQAAAARRGAPPPAY